jgi:hypothetical protein
VVGSNENMLKLGDRFVGNLHDNTIAQTHKHFSRAIIVVRESGKLQIRFSREPGG